MLNSKTNNYPFLHSRGAYSLKVCKYNPVCVICSWWTPPRVDMFHSRSASKTMGDSLSPLFFFSKGLHVNYWIPIKILTSRWVVVFGLSQCPTLHILTLLAFVSCVLPLLCKLDDIKCHIIVSQWPPCSGCQFRSKWQVQLLHRSFSRAFVCSRSGNCREEISQASRAMMPPGAYDGCPYHCEEQTDLWVVKIMAFTPSPKILFGL